MNYYSAYGLCIGSEIALPELACSKKNTPDIIVRVGTLDIDSNQNLTKENEKNHISGFLNGLARVTIKNGNTIILNPLPGIDNSQLSASVINGCMAVALRQRGYLVLHASSVVVNHKAIAFMGFSGAGKSTLAAFFAEKGYKVLTDDVMAIDLRNNWCHVIPSYPLIKLRQNSVVALNCGDGNNFDEYDNKYFYSTKPAEIDMVFPLNKIYVLAIDNYHHIYSLKPQQAFSELVRHTRAINLLKSESFMLAHLEQCSHLIDRVSINKFYRKPGFTEFPLLLKLIEQDISLQPTS